MHFRLSAFTARWHGTIITLLSHIGVSSLSMPLTSKLFKTLSSLSSFKSKVKRLCFLSRGLPIPILFTCSMRTCIILWSESPFKWPCMVNFSLFPPIPFNVSLACRKLRLSFLCFPQRFRLSPKRNLTPFWLLFMAVFAPFLLISRLLAFPC